MQTIEQTVKPEHYALRLKRELNDARETVALLQDRLNSRPEVPAYATWHEGHGCLNFHDKGNERRRTLSGCMDRTEVLFRANCAPVFDISALSVSEILRIGDLPLSKRVSAYDAVFCPRIVRS